MGPFGTIQVFPVASKISIPFSRKRFFCFTYIAFGLRGENEKERVNCGERIGMELKRLSLILPREFLITETNKILSRY